MNWKASASAVSWNIRPFIAGEYRASHSGETFENVDPASETVLCASPAGDAADVDAAVAVARHRFEDGCWSQCPASRRSEILLRLAELLVQQRAELALLDSLEMGKPIRDALFDAECHAPSFLRACAKAAEQLCGAAAPLQPSVVAFNIYEPRGVVGAVTPWNFPIVNAVVKVAPALAAGNSVVLKPSEIASSSALKLAELALEAGVPEGVLNVVPGLGTTVGAALALHPDVDLLTFTGSTATGRKIMELSGRSTGKPLLLECGGKSPHIVFDDVEQLDAVAAACAQGILWNQGQVCSARTRLIVHRRVKAALLEQIVERVCQVRPGHPLDEETRFGPLASRSQSNRVRDCVERAVRAGATAVARGAIRERNGCYVEPTVFDGVTADMAVAREEIFGPVLCVLEFDADDEAIALANATDYGLSATVWTNRLSRAKHLAHAIRAGDVLVRTSGAEAGEVASGLAGEPRKASGFGVEAGLAGLRSYSTLKSVTFTGS